MNEGELSPSEEAGLEDLTVDEMINVCRGKVPDEILEGAEMMEPMELLGLLLGELPSHGIEEPEIFLMESRLVEKIPTRLETLFELLHDKGVDLNISAEAFKHLEGITAPFVQPEDLDSVIGQAGITLAMSEKWRSDMEAGRQKLLLAKIGDRIVGRINLFKDPENTADEDKSVPQLDDLWVEPDFSSQGIEDYLMLAAENYIVYTPALSQSCSINSERDGLLLQTAERLGYRHVSVHGLGMMIKYLEGNT